MESHKISNGGLYILGDTIGYISISLICAAMVYVILIFPTMTMIGALNNGKVPLCDDSDDDSDDDIDDDSDDDSDHHTKGNNNRRSTINTTEFDNW